MLGKIKKLLKSHFLPSGNEHVYISTIKILNGEVNLFLIMTKSFIISLPKLIELNLNPI